MQDPNRITYFASTDTRGKRIPFGLKAKDRQRHMYVIGKTGMGKSTLLQNMAIQDIQNGEGMAFIDPHGSAVETLLQYIPKHRLDDVVYFAPFDLDHPIAFNIMEDVGYDKRHLVVSGLMATFKKIWEDAWSARMEYILTNTLLALLEYPDATLLGVNRMYSDKTYRTKVVDNIKDPVVRSFWVDEYAKYTDKFAAEATPAIQNKIGQFTGNPLIRNIIGQPKSSFDIRKLMDGKKILLINLSKGLVGDTNMRLLGSMLTTRIFLGAMSRAELNPTDLKNAEQFYFYVDEFQNFANDTFAEILSEARKYSLNLIIAHQYVEQMEEQVRAAVFGNVGTSVAFRVGPFDAETLETIFTPEFTKEDLVNIGAYRIYLTLMIDGVGSRPFSAATLPDIEPPRITFEKEAIARSREQFAAPRAKVEEAVFAELAAASAASTGGPVDAPKKSYGPQGSSRTVYAGGNSGVGNGSSGGGPSAPRSDRPAPREQGREGGSAGAPRSQERSTSRPPERSSERSPDRGQERPQERRPQAGASNGPSQSRRDAPNDQPRRESPDPGQNAKTAEDLKAILRGMTAPKEKAEVEKKAAQSQQAVPLKGALADVLARSDMGPAASAPPAQPAPRREQQEVRAPQPERDHAPKQTAAEPEQRNEQRAPQDRPRREETPKPFEVPEETLRGIFNEKI